MHPSQVQSRFQSSTEWWKSRNHQVHWRAGGEGGWELGHRGRTKTGIQRGVHSYFHLQIYSFIFMYINPFIYCSVRSHLSYWFVYPSIWYLNILVLNEYMVFVDLFIILYLSRSRSIRKHVYVFYSVFLYASVLIMWFSLCPSLSLGSIDSISICRSIHVSQSIMTF